MATAALKRLPWRSIRQYSTKPSPPKPNTTGTTSTATTSAPSQPRQAYYDSSKSPSLLTPGARELTDEELAKLPDWPWPQHLERAFRAKYAPHTLPDPQQPKPKEGEPPLPPSKAPLLADLEPTRVPDPKTARMPKAVQALYLQPLRRRAEHGLPVCDLQMRSYSVRNLEFFADFALRAAYYLNLPAFGPVPLPRIIERWTVPRGHFIHKKSQENFERKTLRRLIQIRDGSAEGVELWLAFLRKHAYYGIGMKANVYEFAGVNVGKDMDAQMERMRNQVEPLLGQFAFKEGSAMADRIIETINEEDRRVGAGHRGPMINMPDYRKPLN